jgi:carotenoid cleavage dioxygenase-like enzyme
MGGAVVTMLEAETVARPGYLAGFASLDSEVELDSLPVEGEIPAWLSGTLLRNGPAKFEAGEKALQHWFDGQAMLHRFSFDAGRVAYANRFLRTEAYREIEAGRISYSEFATDPCRSVFKRMATMFRPRLTDNCNVNLARLGDEYIAMTETPLPIAFDPQTLEALGVAYEPPGMLTTAHPHHDPERGELVAYATNFGPRSEYRVYAQRDRHRQRPIASLSAAEPSYMHSFALTERYVVLVAFPFVVNPLRLGLGARPFIENYRWKPQLGTKLHVFEREDGSLRGTYEAGPCFSFHHVNAFEREDELVLDLVAYEDASIVEALYLDRLRAGAPPEAAEGRLRRYRVALASGAVVEEELCDSILELPRIDYRERNGRPYRFVYGAGAHRDSSAEPGDFLDQLVKVDVEGGEPTTWWEPGSYPGEPVFVPSPRPDRAEDEGALLSVVLDGRSASSYLLVLDAKTMEEVGRARVPHHIPFGFHGQYFA